MTIDTTGPKITVIIPTRERGDVLEKSLQTVINQDYENLEIIVSDNFSADRTKDVVLDTRDKRVRYLNTERRLSMARNWEFALSHVDDGWVTIIGDDDGLLPTSINRVAKIMRSADIKAIRSAVCEYSWPSLTKTGFGILNVPLRSGFEIRDSKVWLSKVLNGLASYPMLPMLYNGGFVSVSILKQIKAKTGAFYSSCIPDLYSAIAVSSIIESYIYLNEPLAVNGASRHSTGTSQFSAESRTVQTPANVFASEGNIPMHGDIPLCADGSYPPSLQALAYESYLQSEPLRGGATKDMHSRQLELILATSGRHATAIRDWGLLFATKHGLDFEALNAKANRRRVLLRLSSMPGQLAMDINTCRLGSPDCPIRDVHEATIAAEAVRSVSPSKIRNIRRVMGRVREKLKSKRA
jgi:Glycosyl transferase family 2